MPSSGIALRSSPKALPMGLSPVIHADKPSWHRAALSCTGAFSVSLCRALQLSVINALVMGLLLLGVLRVPNVLPTLMPAEDPTLRILRNAEETYQVCKVPLRTLPLHTGIPGTWYSRIPGTCARSPGTRYFPLASRFPWIIPNFGFSLLGSGDTAGAA